MRAACVARGPTGYDTAARALRSRPAWPPRGGPLRVDSRRHRHCSVSPRMVWGRWGAVTGAVLVAAAGVGCGGDGSGVGPGNDAGAADSGTSPTPDGGTPLSVSGC